MFKPINIPKQTERYQSFIMHESSCSSTLFFLHVFAHFYLLLQTYLIIHIFVKSGDVTKTIYLHRSDKDFSTLISVLLMKFPNTNFVDFPQTANISWNCKSCQYSGPACCYHALQYISQKLR